MTIFRNNAKGPRGVLLSSGSYVFLQPGETKSIDGSKIRRGVPNGVVEVDPKDAPIVEDADEGDFDAPTAAEIEHESGEGALLDAVDYPANLVIVSIGEKGVHTVTAPWLPEPEDYADYDTAEARQAELREIGPPEGWVDPLDRDENGEPGGSKKAEPPALTGKTKAELAAIAEAEGVDISKATNNGERAKLIEAARAEASSS